MAQPCLSRLMVIQSFRDRSSDAIQYPPCVHRQCSKPSKNLTSKPKVLVKSKLQKVMTDRKLVTSYKLQQFPPLIFLINKMAPDSPIPRRSLWLCHTVPQDFLMLKRLIFSKEKTLGSLGAHAEEAMLWRCFSCAAQAQPWNFSILRTWTCCCLCGSPKPTMFLRNKSKNTPKESPFNLDRRFNLNT